MVAAAHPGATRAGVSILKKGGNAVDAAVAAALALCVCEPQACSLGGQSHGLLRVNGRSLFLDGSGRVPLHLDRAKVAIAEVRCGYKGTSVPTTPVVLACMQKRFGRLHWHQVLEPAMELAHDGYRITQLQHDLQERELELFRMVPGESGSGYFLKNGTSPYEVGEVFTQPDLARLLKRLADYGMEDFYTGRTGKRIVEDVAENGGFLAEDDLKAIPWPHQRQVIEQRVFGHMLHTSPPPAQGRLLVYNLKVAEAMAERGCDLLAEESMVLFADLFCRSYLIRMKQSPYPDLYSCDIDDILAPHTIEETAELVLQGGSGEAVPADLEGGETTHLSVIDRDGNCAGITQSVNMVYGSKAAAGGLGFLYNNYLIDSFSLPVSHPHAMVPGRIPPCSVAPFFLLGRDGRPWLVGGSPGSQRIVTSLTLFLVRILFGGIPMDQAMRMPRYHSQEFGRIVLEAGRFPEETIRRMEEEGYMVKELPSFYFGAIHAVLKKSRTRKYQGVAEARRDGKASAVN